jgi:hypothetical protein
MFSVCHPNHIVPPDTSRVVEAEVGVETMEVLTIEEMEQVAGAGAVMVAAELFGGYLVGKALDDIAGATWGGAIGQMTDVTGA